MAINDQVHTNIGFVNDFHQGGATHELQHRSYLGHFHPNDLEQPSLNTFKRWWAASGGFIRQLDKKPSLTDKQKRQRLEYLVRRQIYL